MAAKDHYREGLKLISSGSLDGAFEMFHKALEEDPEFYMGHLGLAQVLDRQGKVDEAILHARMRFGSLRRSRSPIRVFRGSTSRRALSKRRRRRWRRPGGCSPDPSNRGTSSRARTYGFAPVFLYLHQSPKHSTLQLQVLRQALRLSRVAHFPVTSTWRDSKAFSISNKASSSRDLISRSRP